MVAVTVPKPHSLRLPRAIDTQVRAYALSLARHEHAARIPIGRALVTLVEAGLKSIHTATSPKNGLNLVLRELDPDWSGNPLRDVEPVAASTRSGKTPVELLLERRG
jgi:hypothetical protein